MSCRPWSKISYSNARTRDNYCLEGGSYSSLSELKIAIELTQNMNSESIE